MVTDQGMVNISIGDVSGHDIHAAVITSLVRHTLNAAGQHLDDPAEVLCWANKALSAQVEVGRFVTAAHGQFRPATETVPAVLHLALAGHPQPILIPANGGSPREIGEPGTLLGVAEAPTLTTTRTELAALVVQVRLAAAAMTRSRGDAELERRQPTQWPAAAGGHLLSRPAVPPGPRLGPSPTGRWRRPGVDARSRRYGRSPARSLIAGASRRRTPGWYGIRSPTRRG